MSIFSILKINTQQRGGGIFKEHNHLVISLDVLSNVQILK